MKISQQLSKKGGRVLGVLDDVGAKNDVECSIVLVREIGIVAAGFNHLDSRAFPRYDCRSVVDLESNDAAAPLLDEKFTNITGRTPHLEHALARLDRGGRQHMCL